MRDAYVFHILDYVLQDRTRVHYNDIKILEENNKGMITLDNVFELAKEQQEAEQSSEEEENSDIDTPEEDEEELEAVELGDPKKKKKVQKPLSYLQLDPKGYLSQAQTDFFKSLPTQDQGFTRPKVLILAPFKQMAF